MNFKRRSIKGRSCKLYKEWLDETKQYRIVWTGEVCGVRVPPHFFATVRTVLPDGREMWDFAGHRGPCKTFKKATEECEANKRLWTKAMEAGGIRTLRELFGHLPIGMPVWVKKRIRRDLYELLINPAKVNQDDKEPEEKPEKQPHMSRTSRKAERKAVRS